MSSVDRETRGGRVRERTHTHEREAEGREKEREMWKTRNTSHQEMQQVPQQTICTQLYLDDSAASHTPSNPRSQLMPTWNPFLLQSPANPTLCQPFPTTVTNTPYMTNVCHLLFLCFSLCLYTSLFLFFLPLLPLPPSPFFLPLCVSFATSMWPALFVRQHLERMIRCVFLHCVSRGTTSQTKQTPLPLLLACRFRRPSRASLLSSSPSLATRPQLYSDGRTSQSTRPTRTALR